MIEFCTAIENIHFSEAKIYWRSSKTFDINIKSNKAEDKNS